jgi:hypothetical protein
MESWIGNFGVVTLEEKNCHLQPSFGNKAYILQLKIYMQTKIFN